MLAPTFRNHYNEVPIIKTIASQKEGIPELYSTISHQLLKHHHTDKKYWLLAERAWQLIVSKRMEGIHKAQLKQAIEEQSKQQAFNLYRFIKNY